MRGLVTSALRARVWPLLLGVDLAKPFSYEEYEWLTMQQNEFRGIIAQDVHRSLFHFYNPTQEEQRTQQREKLERILNAVVNYHRGKISHS